MNVFIIFMLLITLKVHVGQSNSAIYRNGKIEPRALFPNWFLIYPGTKWCGVGSKTSNEIDLGKFNNTDFCCRNHDNCDDSMAGFSSKHGLKNPVFYTRLACSCDYEFYNCLKDVNSAVSKNIGFIYFDALDTQCFKKDFPIVSCKKYRYLPFKKCVQYELDTTREKSFQWFDVPAF